MRRMILGGAIASLLLVAGVSRAENLGTEIDLTTFGDVANETAAKPSVWDEYDLEEVGLFDRGNRANRRFYASGMIGPTFGTINDTVAGSGNGTIFSAGGAAGVAFDRRNGYLRLELEGMWRDDLITTTASAFNGWSVLQNVWRDFLITERFGVYGGGGLGGGGYQFDGVTASPTFAWQGGGGLIYEVTSRLTFDVGYRYFQIDRIDDNQFTASELMFTLRLYDPLRRWRG